MMAVAGRGARTASLDWRPFAAGAATVTAMLVGFAVWAEFGPRAAATGAGDLAGIAAAGLAGASCWFTASRTDGRRRRFWTLMALSALSWSLAALVSEAHLLVLGTPPPDIWLDEPLRLAATPLAIAAVLSVPTAPSRLSSRSRALIDGAIIACSLLYVGLALGVIGADGDASPLVAAVTLARPAGGIVMLTVLGVALGRRSPDRRGRLLLLFAGLAANALSGSAFAVFGGTGSQLPELGWSFGYAVGFGLIAIAPYWPLSPGEQASEERPPSVVALTVPWIGVAAAIATSVVVTLSGRIPPTFLIFPGAALVVLLFVSQVLAYRDSLMFLGKSKEAETALQARTAVLNQVITHAPLGVARIDAEGRFIDANPRLGSLLHAPMKVLLGAHIREFNRRTGQTTDEAYAELAAGRRDMVEDDGEVRRADGSAAWLHWSTTAVRKADGSFDYFLAMVEDITARHEADEAAMANLDTLERLNKMKSEFVSMVSHEFRTALVGIQGFSELIRDDDLDIGDIKGLAGDINADALRLNRMITEMLDLDRMEAGKIRLTLKPVDLNALIRDAVERAQMTTDEHTIVADLDPALPLSAGDSDRLVQVLSNLLSNAVKYSPQGGVITVSSRMDAGEVHVSVQDHGLGIPKEFLDHVFGRYERYESNRAGKLAGTGLGLAISHQIVELHGGRMWVESELGKGSTFHFAIPPAVSAQAQQAESSAA